MQAKLSITAEDSVRPISEQLTPFEQQQVKPTASHDSHPMERHMRGESCSAGRGDLEVSDIAAGAVALSSEPGA